MVPSPTVLECFRVLELITNSRNTDRRGAAPHELHPDLPASARRQRQLLRFQRHLPPGLRINGIADDGSIVG